MGMKPLGNETQTRIRNAVTGPTSGPNLARAIKGAVTTPKPNMDPKSDEPIPGSSIRKNGKK